jgi:hypothetical protein
MKARSIDHVPLDSAEAAARVEHGVPFRTDVRWPAHDRWSREYLKTRVRPKPIVIFKKLDGGGTEKTEVDVRDYIDIVSDPTWGRSYELVGFPQTRLWIDGGPDPSLGALMDDLTFPPIVERERTSSINLWIGAGGYDNDNHYDPNGMNNLNVQVVGAKRWRLFHPNLSGVLDLTPALSSVAPPLLSSYCKRPDEVRERAGYAEAELFETVVETGQAIFVPAFWYHWVTYEAELTTNVNFWWAPRKLPLTSTTSAWAFVNALVAVFRARNPGAKMSQICEAIAALDPTTRSLLVDIERTLLAGPSVISGSAALRVRGAESGLLPGEGLDAEGHRDRR